MSKLNSNQRVSRRIDYDDIQVKEAIEDRERCYDSIKRLKRVEGVYMQFIAGDIIRFQELKIKLIDEALYKKGLGNYVLKSQVTHQVNVSRSYHKTISK